jgi:hypothetical protein
MHFFTNFSQLIPYKKNKTPLVITISTNYMSLEKLQILPTKCTPAISLNPDGIIKIRGRYINGNKNVSELFKQTEEWIDEYIRDPADLTCVDIFLEYFNGINLNTYISILKKIESVNLKNKKYIINWYYEEGDEDILETGEYISLILHTPFNFIKVFDS